MFSVASRSLAGALHVVLKCSFAASRHATDALFGLAHALRPPHHGSQAHTHDGFTSTICSHTQSNTHTQTAFIAGDASKAYIPTSSTTSPLQLESAYRFEMAEAELRAVSRQLQQALQNNNFQQCQQLLSKAKIALLNLNALIPSSNTPTAHLLAAREMLELGAIVSIRMNNEQSPESFTRYFQQLQPFYALPASQLPVEHSQQSRVTGLYLLLLLSTSDYGGFHTMLETLEMAKTTSANKGLEDDEFIQYPVRLEQALMEGSYDRVWQETKGSSVPGEEYGIFSGFLINTIRDEIASCSEKAYASVPISNAKNLFFLDSEGAVVQFAQSRGWITKDGRIYFPHQDQDLLASEKDILSASDQVIENTLGYARELETIV